MSRRTTRAPERGILSLIRIDNYTSEPDFARMCGVRQQFRIFTSVQNY